MRAGSVTIARSLMRPWQLEHSRTSPRTFLCKHIANVAGLDMPPAPPDELAAPPCSRHRPPPPYGDVD
jgi:hypothetical protein